MSFLRAALGIAVLLAAGAVGLDRAFPPDLSRLDAVGTEVVDAQGRTVALLPAAGGVWRFRAGPEEVSPVFLDQLVRTEDRRFWAHPGVDPWALARAAVQWVRAGHVVSGGSTLAMQAARLLEPRPRTLRSKAIEMFRALQLEARYGRQGVLGIWLSLAPYGGNLEGVRAGAMAWFGVSPAALDAPQSALLVAIPRRPEALRPDRYAARALALRDRILGGPDPAAVPDRRMPLPRHAAQAVAALGPGPRIATTLDLPLQIALERLAEDRRLTLPPRASMAVLVADIRTREIRAIVPGFRDDAQRAGALDLTQAVRSPGSALKPFIYALAFQDGIAGPNTPLADLPRRFGAYAPENFDRGFAGSVTAADALRRSLNLPAVALLDRVGPLRFLATVKAAGVRLVLPEGADASLPLALGGAGISLRDAAGLYAALGSDGHAQPLRLAGAASPGATFLSADPARAIADILTRPFPRGGPDGIAWKTGTSWGGRDAWALGFDAAHVAAVWIGRPDGTPVPGATGTSLALPLLARVFDLLPPAARPAPPPDRVAVAAARSDALQMLFPPPGAVLSADGPVTIRAMGGRRPLTFLVDGTPLPTEPVRRDAGWTPAGPGFYRLTILDADGTAARAAVRVK